MYQSIGGITGPPGLGNIGAHCFVTAKPKAGHYWVDDGCHRERDDNKDDVLQLKNNLRKYIDIKKTYYDKMDKLLKESREKLNYGSKQDERLSGTAAQFIEKLEVKYVNDLNEFYEFILSHHEKMNFAEDQIYLEDQALVDNLNTLFERAVKSSTELTSAQEIGKKMMGDSVKEWQEEINTK